MTLTPADADRGARDASIVLALTLPTDTVLYLLLPLQPGQQADVQSARTP